MADPRHLLSVAKAARLVNVRRGDLQRRIKSGELRTFEGMLDLVDLAQAFPNASLDFNPELERVRKIQDKAFGKRVLERLLPEPEVMMARIGQLGKELLQAHEKLGAYRGLLAQLSQMLEAGTPRANADENLRAQLRQWLAEQGEVMHRASPNTDNLWQHSRVLQVMAPHVRLLPSEHEFFVEGNDTILDAGLREGLAVNYGCSNGNCGQCKAKVISGQARQSRHFDYRLTEWEKMEGYILMCAHTPLTDMVIEAQEAGSAADLPQQHINAKVKAITALSAYVTMLHLQTPRTNRLRFFAGQSVQLQYGEGRSVNLPIASCPCDDRNLQFHVSRRVNAEFYDFLQAGGIKNGSLQLIGPEGDFVLDDEATRPLLMLAMDCGFAPVKSLVEHAIAVDNAPQIQLCRFSEQADFYLDNLCRSWTDALDNIDYQAVTTELPAWLGDFSQRLPELQQTDIYVAGPEAFVSTVTTALAELPHIHTFVCGNG